MYNLYFLDYNTYGNRLVKKESSLSDYLTYEVARETSANFNINDGVNTLAVVNSANTGNYLVVADSNSNIHSRWFIMENQYKRNGQHFVTLKRDLMVDYWDSIKTAPCFIEKATLNENDPLIFNSENMSFNQIKTSETPLKDETGCAWVVGYIPSDALQNNDVHGNVILDHAYDYSVNNLSDLEIYQYSITPYNSKPHTDLTYDTIIYNYSNSHYDIEFPIDGSGYAYEVIRHNPPLSPATGLEFGTLTSIGYNSLKNYVYANKTPEKLQTLRNVTLPFTNYTGNNALAISQEELLDYDKKIVKTANGEYYRINIVKSGLNPMASFITAQTSLANAIEDLLVRDQRFDAGRMVINGTPNNNTFKLSYSYFKYTVTFEQIFVDASVHIDSTRYHLEDQPYDMFCIPYSDDLKIYKNGTQILTANKSIAVNMAVNIGKAAGSAAVYDVQLLPYCPVRYMIMADNTFDIQDARVHYIKDSDNQNIGVILWATKSAFTLNINHSIEITDVKVQNECDKYRITSPNFNGQFEFSAAKNGGVSSFNVDCNYKPFNPYIHINPNFGRLYGQDFNDARGLICGGDFSLPQLSNAWSNYELQNKNYQNIFNRQIENMEVNNALNNISSGIGALGNAIGFGLSTGSVVGGVLAAAGGAADLGLQIAQQQETLDYTKDLFGYQLGNIKAIPTSLTKTSAFTYNNKIFPILEYYTCTDEEKQALRDKITYNGMTVMRIGKIEDYIKSTVTYIKGQLIRLQISDDNHLLEAIREEVNKGVYV